VTGEGETVAIALGDRSLPDAFADVEAAIERAASGEALDLTTADELVVKYVVPTAAVRGVRSAFRRDAALGWRITLRPRAKVQGSEQARGASEGAHDG